MSTDRPRTLLERIWDEHVIAELGDGLSLLHVDRHLLHDLSGPYSFAALQRRGLRVRNPELTFATPDHGVSTEPDRRDDSSPVGARLLPLLREGCAREEIRLFDLHDAEQGIVHVVGPELGLTLPGTTLVCGDSHTCTHGGLGALGWGIGSSELTHVLATQTIVERRPRTLRLALEGSLAPGVEPKDLILHAIGRFGAGAGVGCAVEYAGGAVRSLDIEGRLTLCNLSIELGSKMGMVAPDEHTFAYLEGRPFAPRGELFERALSHWQRLRSDDDARFDRELSIDAGRVAPQITWGTSPEHTLGVDGVVPDPDAAPDAATRAAWRAALAYMDLVPGRPIAGLRIDRVFIGSCTNGRLGDLRRAARIVRGRRVAKHVRAWVVPGSMRVRLDAEAEGLDRVFTAAGFEWRTPGCSSCSASNGETLAPGERCVSTSNRNFVGRQGPGARTHLASLVMAAAAAVTGEICDARRLGAGA